MSKGKKRKMKYFPNNWKAYKDAPVEAFVPCDFEEFAEWKLNGWELPESVACIIREERKDGSVREHVYQRVSFARQKLGKIIIEGGQAVVVDHESTYIVYGTHPKEDQDEEPSEVE